LGCLAGGNDDGVNGATRLAALMAAAFEKEHEEWFEP
jgi:hypothetical protein